MQISKKNDDESLKCTRFKMSKAKFFCVIAGLSPSPNFKLIAQLLEGSADTYINLDYLRL